ncbi:MAG: DUF192 domain-containing protein [Ilumatobacteraceae bacterium]
MVGFTAARVVAIASCAMWVASCGSSDGSSEATDVVVESSSGPVASSGGMPPDGTDRSAPEQSGQQPDGFSNVMARITEADGEACEVCLWLADTGDERARGLMGVTDLGDASGMAFRFEQPFRGSFYMFQTPTPLSIAFVGADGDVVGVAEMDPCLDTPAGDCPRYAPDEDYDLAVEVFAGGLDPLGIGPGSTVVLLDGTEAPSCAEAMALLPTL